ncbi:hypothetical protein J2W54_001824 [Rhodococcus fascians]|uniref:hypothetical protein n=1 Tax=Nocardiaceae TaxID=85025 RepID=UPI00285E0DD1|nr:MULTISPECIES: hypothetical protein [Rhodococcus]MDR6909906.1 hypothetical protein [Rhodococcus sp. 3258]MDR6931448.1 hypothetical protein [Rhodococcus fascians]
MSSGRRNALRRRYLSLGLGELSAAAVFASIALTMAEPRLDGREESLAMWSVLIPLLAVLVQAGIYWLMARSWVELNPMPPVIRAFYRVCRVANVPLLAAGLIGVVVWFPSSAGIGVALLVVWLFAVVEFVNYFVVRLSYPAHRWWPTVGQMRTPRLVLDINTRR